MKNSKGNYTIADIEEGLGKEGGSMLHLQINHIAYLS